MKQDVLDYLRYTPANTNVNVVSTMLGSDGGGELPEEVKNAILTHGMGWTSEEPVPAINITWDGNTEGRESFGGDGTFFYKVNDKELTVEELVGSTVSVMFEGTIEQHIILNSDIETEGLPEDTAVAYIEFDSGITGIIYSGDFSELSFGVSNGTYFSKTSEGGVTAYISSLTKEASTQEVVHQIDEKYIPSSGVMVVNFDFAYTEDGYTLTADKTVEEIMEAYWQGVVRGKIHYHVDDDVTIMPSICEIADDRPMFLYMGDGKYVEALEWDKSDGKWVWQA